MTLVNTIIRPERAAVLADSAFYTAQPAPLKVTGDHDADARSVLNGDGQAPAGTVAFHGRKLLTLRHQRLAVAALGSAHAWSLARFTIEWTKPDFDGLRTSLDVIVQEAVKRAPTDDLLMLAVVGWSEHGGRVRGIACASGDGAIREVPDGPACHPPLDPDEPCPAAGWTASDPDTLLAQQRAFARQQYATWRAGRYNDGLALGGELHAAIVDHNGAALVEVGSLERIAV